MKAEPALNLGPQPTPELEAIAREVDALARERLALEAEHAAKQRDLAVKTGEADSLQSELDTLTATLKQLENQKGEAQKRLNDLKTQVDKLRSQVSAQECAASETEAEVAARRAAANTLKEKERALNEEAAEADAQADALTAQLRRTVLAVSQANIKISHLEEQHRLISSALEQLSSGAPAAQTFLELQPQFTQPHLERAVRGATPSDALEDESFSASNGFDAMNGGGFNDPFKGQAFSDAPHDPFAPNSNTHSAQDGFGSDPFGASSDPFAGDAFAPSDNDNANVNSNQDGAWEADPFAVLHAPTRATAGAPAVGGAPASGAATPALPPKAHKMPPPRPAPPRPTPPHKTAQTAQPAQPAQPARSDRAMDFADDPFKDYRYEDPFNIEDPFADVTDARSADPFGRPTSVAGFETDDFFSASTINGSFAPPQKRSGRVSAPPIVSDPFASISDHKLPSKPINSNNNEPWAAWPASQPWDDTPAASAWANNTTSPSSDWKTDNWATKADNWADWGADQNKNLNETWPSSTLPSKKEKSPKPVKYAKSLVHTIGGIGRSRQKDKKAKGAALEARSVETLPTEEQQWAWAAAESKRLEKLADERRRQEDAELQLALAISRQEK